MAEVLVYVDHVDGAVRKPTLELLTLARRIGEPVALAVGAGAGETAGVLGEHGAVKVLTVEAPEFAEYLVVPKVEALQAAVEAVSPVAVLVPSSAGAVCGVMRNSDVRQDAWGRLLRTADFVGTLTYGTTAASAPGSPPRTRTPASGTASAMPRCCCGCTARRSPPAWTC
ncbi:hypothetical protein EAO77_33705 [Streptomyces sp. t39]|nr:hypothetical protein EAO77_33705 [Streptomyces sp. t39]